jgi:hypothetical protein
LHCITEKINNFLKMCFCSSPGLPKNRKEETPRETLLVSFGSHCGADEVSVLQGMSPYKLVNN